MKKIIIGALLLGVLSGVGYFVYRFRQESTPQAYFESGKKYFGEKKYREAMIAFLNALRKAPSDRNSRYYLALSYIGLEDYKRGGKLLRSLVETNPDDVEASLSLGRLYMKAAGDEPKSEAYSRAQELAQQVLSKDPQNVDALILSANAFTGMQDYAASQNLLEKAVNLEPKNTAAFVSLGVNQARQQNYDQAEGALLKARDANPKDVNVRVALALFYRSRKDAGKEETAWKEALALNPKDRTVYSELAVFYLRAGHPEEMEKVLRDAQAASPDDPAPAIILASIYEAANHAPEARKILLEAKKKFPKSIDLSVKLAANEMQDQPNEARKEIDQMLQLEPRNPVGHILLGELQYKTGKFDEAEATLGRDPALNSPFPQVHFLLGNLSRRKGLVDQAQDQYQKALALNREYLPARLALAEVFVAKGRLQDSREEVKKALQVQPGNPAARLMKAQLDLVEGKLADAELSLSGLLKEEPNNPAILRQMAIYQQTRGNSREAEKDLLHAIEIAPDSEQLFRDLTALYQITRQPDRALQRLNSVPQKQAFHYEILGTVLAQTGKAQEAENAYRKALEIDPKRLGTEMLLVELYAQTNRTDEAIKTLDDLAQKEPKNNELLALKGNLLQIQGKNRLAEESYRKALQADPNIDLAANNLAYILAEDGRDLQSALQYAQNVKKRKSEDPNIADTLGWVYFKLGRLESAREQAEFAASHDPKNGSFQYHLGMIYRSKNERDKAEAALKKATASGDFKEKNLADDALKDIEHWRHLVKP
jgi:tetratricopeptide (TPR) repeat protein